jgi:hypothetical protein
MDDLELYIYIALALIYFFSRAFRKKKRVKPPQSTQRTSSDDAQRPAARTEKPLTFEDLLREFTGQKEEKAFEGEEIIEMGEDVLNDQRYDYTEDNLSDTNTGYNQDTYKNYEEIYGSSKNLKTLDEQVSLDTRGRKRFDTYKIKESENIHVAQRFREILKNKNTVKDAIILKEILDRKYF